MVLKDKDIKLLTLLFENSRRSNRQLAKDLGITKETVASRINYFTQNSYIKSYSLKLNYELLGYEEYNLFIRLKNVNNSSISEFLKYLEEHPNTTWIGKSFGKYDLKIALILKSKSRINEIINNISQKFGKNIEVIDYLLVVDKFKASPKLFLSNLFNMTDIILSGKKKPDLAVKNPELDELDKKIIFDLGENPSISYVNLALKYSITAEAIKYRINRLESKNIILGNSIVFNGNKFNKIWCLLLLNINPEKIVEFKTYLKSKNFISSYVETMGVWNFNVTFFANDMEGLYNELNTIRNEYSSDIRNFEFLIFFDFYKFPKIPKCILE